MDDQESEEELAEDAQDRDEDGYVETFGNEVEPTSEEGS